MPSRPVAAIVSFRLGGTDGVSVEAAKWGRALEALGFSVRRVAGSIDGGTGVGAGADAGVGAGADAGVGAGPGAGAGDTVVPELGLGAVGEPDPRRIETALSPADLVVVENLCSLPLNLPAARAVLKVLAAHPRVVFHHHDLPWQRAEHAHVTELPARLAGAVHVTINDLSRRELAGRGFEAVVVRNHFDLTPAPGDRGSTRAALGLGDGDVLVLHPVRAIPRKNVPGAIALCEGLAQRLPGSTVHYWLPGPAEDGYSAELEAAVAASGVPVLRARPPSMADAYAACDLVAFPSTWEGFGNPVVESVAARRPLAVGRYPALDELEALGFSFLSVDDPTRVAAVLAGAHDISATLEANVAVAARHLSIERLPDRLAAVIRSAGRR